MKLVVTPERIKEIEHQIELAQDISGKLFWMNSLEAALATLQNPNPLLDERQSGVSQSNRLRVLMRQSR